MRKLFRLLFAGLAIGVAHCPPVFGAASDSITQAEAESFVRSFYHDLAGQDFDKVIAHFDQKVLYYSEVKDRDYVASDLGKYCASYPSRSFTIDEIKLTPLPKSEGVTVKFDIRFFIRNPERDITRYGRSHVDWDLAKRDGAVKIIRYDGRVAEKPAASPSP